MGAMFQRSLDVTRMYSSLADGDNVTYVLSSELCFVHQNAAWERFARANGGERCLERWKPGSSLLDAVSGELKQFFEDGFAHAARSESRWDHDYECSSPTQFRKYRMMVYPIGGSFVVTHALLVSVPHEPSELVPGATYERQGFVAMCSHCRRVRRSDNPECWDWVPAYVSTVRDNISHGLCTACYRFYYNFD
jgi:hypothetical protein